MKDTTFSSVYQLQLEEIKEKQGCSKCRHKTKKYWNKWLCRHNNRVNKKGFCKYWKYEGD